MHDCQRFREELTDLVLGGKTLESEGVLAAEMNSCEGCLSFYQDSLELLRVMDSAEARPPALSDEYWEGFGDRLRRNLINDRVRPMVKRIAFWHSPGFRRAALGLAAAAVVVVTLVGYRAMEPRVDGPATRSGPRVHVIDDHIIGLDPGTIEFFEQSELFLRSFVKLEPSDFEDLEDARVHAQLQLAGLNQRKEAVAAFYPVQTVLDEYETVLRDIHNLSQDSGEDIAEIRGRIERNGLIANMKVYQPRVVVMTEQ